MRSESFPIFPGTRIRRMAAGILSLCLFLCACAPRPTLSSVSAGARAASLANARCQKEYGKRPFEPEDFEARLDRGRWHWGTPDGGKVDGFEAEVSFDRQGGSDSVRVRIPPE